MRRNLFVLLGSVIVVIVMLAASCRKINMATDLGKGVIPEVDNIHTFDTTVEVSTYNNIFTALNDTFKTTGNHEQFLGLITNDPIFGKTDARMYFGIGLPSAKFAFANTPDKVFIDSVVLILKYTATYGDTTIPQTIRVSEISQAANFEKDSLYSVRNNNFPTTNFLGSATIIPTALRDSIYLGKDTTRSVRNLRIKLDNSLATRLKGYDSTNAFFNDSAFKKHFKGVALRSTAGGNAVMGFGLANANTGIAIYYRYENKTTAGDMDTTVAYFPASPPVANYIGRDYTGTQIPVVSNDNVADQLVYIQNTPGTYATLKIPALANMNNRIIHLAQLQIQSVYDQSDTLFRAPGTLFMDVYDAVAQKYAAIPYSLAFLSDATGSPVLSDFGSYPKYQKDNSGNSIREWRFDLSRYVQNIVNGKLKNNDLRLYAAPETGVYVYNPPTNTYSEKVHNFSLGISPVKGRVRLAGGNHPTQKMKMRIVYSKL